MKQLFFIIFSAYAISCAFAQVGDSLKMVKYDLSYEFDDGIFLAFDDFRNNKALPFSQTNLPSPREIDPEQALIEAGKLDYFDQFGNRKTISIENIWGYAYQDRIHIYYLGGFHIIPYIGSISHFVAQVIIQQNRMHDPFYDPYYRYTGPSSYTRAENLQLMLDLKNGKTYRFSHETVGELIKSDKALHQEFMDLRKRKKKKLMFYYIRQYNEKNPVYFPTN
ncbi:MAG: hypothetical protein PF448_03410 [Bacteroidales bacterium]|jgi:hypothetical protein|nr:hypothetical protein [Bacteroidales bacterium]